MLFIGTINFIIDPGEIYIKKILGDKQGNKFASKLFNSKYGIVQTGWNERLIKTRLAKKAGDFTCIILGSSHIMQISSVRNTGHIKTKCGNILNLGVSGGTLEDIAIFSYLILTNKQLPKQIFIGIDPWTLKFEVDSRFGAYVNYYNQMTVLLKEKTLNKKTSYTYKLIKNLFSGEYFYKSLVSISKTTSLFNKKIIFPKNKFSFQLGYNEPVTLTDGSHVYSSSYLLEQKLKNPKIGQVATPWGIKGEVYDKLALRYLQKLINLYQRRNVKINFILTPYHPNIFKKENAKLINHITITEKIIHDFSSKNNIRLYGSYFPRKLKCKTEEFHDYMHGTSHCLDKINFAK